MSVRAETVRETGAGPRGLSRRLAALGPGVVLAVLGVGLATSRGAVPAPAWPAPQWVICGVGAGQAGAIRYPRSPRGELDHMRLHRGTSAAPAR